METATYEPGPRAEEIAKELNLPLRPVRTIVKAFRLARNSAEKQSALAYLDNLRKNCPSLACECDALKEQVLSCRKVSSIELSYNTWLEFKELSPHGHCPFSYDWKTRMGHILCRQGVGKNGKTINI